MMEFAFLLKVEISRWK